MRKLSPAEDNLRDRIQSRWTKNKVWWWSQDPTTNKGIPDVGGVYHGVPFMVEFKAADGVLMAKQLDWLEQLFAHGGLALLVRANPTAPSPWGAEYRFVSKGFISNPYPIDNDRWLEELVQQILESRRS